MSINQFKKTAAKKYMLLIQAEEVYLTDQEKQLIEKRIAIELDGLGLAQLEDGLYRLVSIE